MKQQAATWMQKAGLLAGRLPLERLHPEVRAWTEQSCPRGPWMVALSGGADSVLLLLLLWAHFPAKRAKLIAVHYDHRLRGRASDGDAEFCRKLCQALAIPLRLGRRLGTEKIQSEAQARDLRFAFIEREMLAARAKVLWLGHQQNDVAETMLMRLARGSGAGGLAAPRPVQPMPVGRFHLRPLLGLAREEIEETLRSAQAPWREDASNQRGDFFRNRIRLEVLPAWVAASGRDALAGAARSRELIAEDDSALEGWAAKRHAAMPKGVLDLAVLAEVPRAVTRRVLHRWLLAQPQAGALSRQAFDLLLDALIKGDPTRQSLGKAGFAVIRRKQLRFEQGPKKPGKRGSP